MYKIRLIISVLLLLHSASCDRGAPATGPQPRPDRSSSSPASQAARASTAAAGDQQQHERLYGTWVARDVDVSMGEVKIELTFAEEGPVRILAWSDLPFVGQVRNKKGPYDIQGNTISSSAIRGGTSVDYRFEGKDLIIAYKDGKTVRFQRKS
jgi:hypothetical protein